MNWRNRLIALVGLGGLLAATVVCAQEAPAQNPDSGQAQQQGQGRNRGGQNGERPLFGKITAIHDGAIEIARQDGQTVTVKVNAQTEFHKDRQAAKLTDFKVGDTIIVRGDENPDHTVTAKMIGGRTGGAGGPGSGSVSWPRTAAMTRLTWLSASAAVASRVARSATPAQPSGAFC